MFAVFKGVIGILEIKEGVTKIPEWYVDYSSTINITDNRKKRIEERRGRLKVEINLANL